MASYHWLVEEEGQWWLHIIGLLAALWLSLVTEQAKDMARDLTIRGELRIYKQKGNITGPGGKAVRCTPLEFASIHREGAQPYLTGCTGLGQPESVLIEEISEQRGEGRGALGSERTRGTTLGTERTRRTYWKELIGTDC